MLIENYESHKNSSLSWLDTVPEHWNILALHFAARLNSGEAITALQFNEGGDYPVFGGNGYRGRSDRFTHDGIYVLIGRQGALCGNVNIAKGKFFASEHAIVVSPSMEFNPHWMAYNLQAMNLGQYSVSAAQPGLSAEVIGRLKIVFPPLKEQCAIAGFVDFKTAQIDALIAKKKALLEKLAEKRTAVISHAVTKGLDSSVSMRDSGVEHFLFIPSDWRAIRVRHCIDFLTSGSRGWAEYFSPEGSRFLRITNLTRDSIRIDLSDLKFVLPPMGAEVERTAARPGDVVISITADLGCVAVIPECANNSYVSQHLALLRPINKIIQGHWLAYQVLAMSGKSQLLGAGYGGSKIQLSLDDIKDLWIALPPVEEQIKILEYIGRALQKIDEQTKKVSEAIVRLGEYRSALITNAVTGKIDVRGFQIPADAHAITECNV